MIKAKVVRCLVAIYLKLPVRPFQGILTGLLWKYKLANRDKTVTATIDGITYSLDLSEVIDSFIFFSGCYEPMITTFINKQVKQGMTVIDIGANIGSHTLRCAKLVGENGRVIAFEPTSWAFSKLKRNTELNNYHNITLEKLALSDTTSKDLASFISSWTLNKGGAPSSTTNEEVSFVTLDDYVYLNSIDRIDLIKLDVDGYEYRVLRGGCQTLVGFKPTVIVEFGRFTLGRCGDTVEDLVDLLASLGYSFYSQKDLGQYSSKEQLLGAVPAGWDCINVICQHRDKTMRIHPPCAT